MSLILKEILFALFVIGILENAKRLHIKRDITWIKSRRKEI